MKLQDVDVTCNEVLRTPLHFSLACHHEDTSVLLVSLSSSVLPIINGITNNDKEDDNIDDDDGMNDTLQCNTFINNDAVPNGQFFSKLDDDEPEYEMENENESNGMVDGVIDPFVFAVAKGFMGLAKVFHHSLPLLSFLLFYFFYIFFFL